MLQSRLKLAVLLVALTALFSAAALSAGAVDAGKPGGGGGKGGKPTPTPAPSTASVTLISQNPVPVGTAPTFEARGYPAGALVYMIMSGYIVQEARYADANGVVRYTFHTPMHAPGQYTFTTMQRNGVNSASVSFWVVP